MTFGPWAVALQDALPLAEWSWKRNAKLCAFNVSLCSSAKAPLLGPM